MKKIFGIIALLAFATFLSAQTTDKSKSILDKVSAKNKTYTSMKADFIYSLDNEKEGTHEKTQGVIWIKGKKYKLNLMGVTTYFDGKTIWSHMKKEAEVNITEPDENDESTLDPSKVFTMYESGFTYKFVKESFEKGLELYEIDMFPTDKEKNYTKVTLKIDKAKYHIFSVVYYGKDGNTSTLEIMRFTPDLPMEDTMFTFNKSDHPGVVVNDMR
ncbi:MAG: hypothetical protein A2W91_01935 [Bacteroidetes bacterium GWF2_38_335]|nr:MAG: hypothetical protein A2W91_01935 [Bacteroidetes bacterium GWF2_38_335]OFY80613.1 MAG: hypothetical protein A2281_04950 [Bacteroidetes bacterium RIFOXYA12_FULL_38_20]HBS86953.1 cell envelope biogenesis protein LolA [Bacteroidales bacterium]